MNGATVRAYSLARDGNMYVARNFRVKEFACHDGSDPIFIHTQLPVALQKVRDWAEAPVYIEQHSAYRTPEHNEAVGGSEGSYHMYGMAVDFHVKGKTPKQVAAFLNKLYPNSCGIGIYSWGVHFDFRKTKSRWEE